MLPPPHASTCWATSCSMSKEASSTNASGGRLGMTFDAEPRSSVLGRGAPTPPRCWDSYGQTSQS